MYQITRSNAVKYSGQRHIMQQVRADQGKIQRSVKQQDSSVRVNAKFNAHDANYDPTGRISARSVEGHLKLDFNFKNPYVAMVYITIPCIVLMMIYALRRDN